MKIFKPLSTDSNSLRKLQYLRFTYYACTTLIVLYLLRYNFEYKLYYFNWIFFPCLFLILIAPFIYNKTQNQRLSAATVLVPTSLSILFLVWTAGCLDAPGFVWISAIPITVAAIMGIGDSIAAFAVIALFTIAGYFCKKNGHQINLIQQQAEFEFERMFNFIVFGIYSTAISIFYIRNETKFQNELNSNKEEIDNLLKILIHDVGTPLTTIGLVVSNINGANEAKLAKYKNIIEASLRNVTILLNQIKSMKAAKDGKAAVVPAPTDITKLLSNLSQEIKPRLEQKSINLELSFLHEDRKILADENILQYVILMNLLTNAVKFSNPNGVIEIKTQIDSDRIAIEVRDYGIGMSEALRKKVFNSYEATNRKGTTGESGTGFGLPLAFYYTKKIGGELTIESSEVDLEHFKKGSSFKLKFQTANA
ncbi:MAG: sensor histidine kinase [Pseudobdellovibrionaceae bacterium]